MIDYKLPEGFRWIIKSRGDLEFEHIATEKRARISHCVLATSSSDERLQSEIYRCCAKLLREIALDDLWRECEGNREEFERRRDGVIADWHAQYIRPMLEALS